MKTTILAMAAALTIGIAAPAFAEGKGTMSRYNPASSMPPGFYNGTVKQIYTQIRERWFEQEQQRRLGSSRPNQVNPTSTQPNG
jgi:hypothetical protein